MKLYYSPGACSFASHIVLNELGRPFELERVVIANGDNLKPEYLKINPRGRVPVLLVDGAVLRENSAILTWLGQQGVGLFPPVGSILAARASEWLAWLTSGVHISFMQIWRGQRFLEDTTHLAAIRSRGLATLTGQFAEIEAALSRNPYAIGDSYSVVDANLMPFYRWGSRVGFTMKMQFPKWSDHTQRMLERSAVRQTIASEGIDMWPAKDAWVVEGQGR